MLACGSALADFLLNLSEIAACGSLQWRGLPDHPQASNLLARVRRCFLKLFHDLIQVVARRFLKGGTPCRIPAPFWFGSVAHEQLRERRQPCVNSQTSGPQCAAVTALKANPILIETKASRNSGHAHHSLNPSKIKLLAVAYFRCGKARGQKRPVSGQADIGRGVQRLSDDSQNAEWGVTFPTRRHAPLS